MSNEYTVFGYHEGRNPVVATKVRPPQAKAFARANNLAEFCLALQRPEPGRKADLLTYERHRDAFVGRDLAAWTMTCPPDASAGAA